MGGTQTREECSPSWGLEQSSDARKDHRGYLNELSRRWLSLNGLRTTNPRGGVCRACVRGGAETTVEQQPGRERPPLPPPGPGPEPSQTGVAHAPATCLVCPDEVVRIVRTKWSAHAPSTRHVASPAIGSPMDSQHVETVAAVVHVFLNRRLPWR